MSAPVNVYYVNDATVEPGDWTTSPGDDANDGLTPATPKSSIRRVLEAFDLGAGDIIRVDAGVYNLTTNLIITAADAGVTIEGYHDEALPLRRALIDRRDTGGSSYVIELQDADDVTLEQLWLTGASVGIYAAPGSDSDRLTLRQMVVYGNSSRGIVLYASNDQTTIQNSTFYGVPGGTWRGRSTECHLCGRHRRTDQRQHDHQ